MYLKISNMWQPLVFGFLPKVSFQTNASSLKDSQKMFFFERFVINLAVIRLESEVSRALVSSFA